MMRCAAMGGTICAIVMSVRAGVGDLPRITAQNGHFVNSSGETVRFWGVNMVSAFPPESAVDRIAQHLRSQQVNLVRPHHLLRPSRDWIWQSEVSGLSLLKDDSRTPDPEAWKSFDALNAALRKHGIYLQLSLHNTREYFPGDVSIDTRDAEDAKQWKVAIEELRKRPWQKSIDVKKILPMIDERCEALQREFAYKLLKHRNPYTGICYADDAQVLTLEIVNESSFDYALVCGNTFPDYFERKLQSRWRAFAESEGFRDVPNCRQVKDGRLQKVRARFYRSLDEDYCKRMSAYVRSLGSRAAICFSNLWRGEDALAWQSETTDYVEDHAYVDPFVVRDATDWLDDKVVRTYVADRPYILGEFNVSEGGSNIVDQRQKRTMLPLHVASYGCFQDFDGVTWFAWQHGDRDVNRSDWSAKTEGRGASLGCILADGQMLDHFRLCGLIFRKGLVRRAREFHALSPRGGIEATNYSQLMTPDVRLPFPGAASIHGFVKRIPRKDAAKTLPDKLENATTSGQDGAYVSDTDELIRDVSRQQLLVSAPCVEAFSGKTRDPVRRSFRHLESNVCRGKAGDIDFATMIVVAEDGLPISKSQSLLVSRTGVNAGGSEECGLPAMDIKGVLPGRWGFVVERPAEAMEAVRGLLAVATIPLTNADGSLKLPQGVWRQARIVKE